MTVEKQLIDKVESIRTTLHEISVYNLDVKTSLELYYELARKVNEVITELSRFEGVVSEEVVKQNEKLLYLLGEGLKEQVGIKIDELITNGTIQDLINNKLFGDLNSKLDNHITLTNETLELKAGKSEVNQKFNEVNEQFNGITNKNSLYLTDFGADNTGMECSSDALNNAILNAISKKKKLIVPSGKYIFTKPLSIELTNFNLTVEGELNSEGNEFSTILVYTGTGLFLNFIGGRKLTFKNIEISGDISEDYIYRVGTTGIKSECSLVLDNCSLGRFETIFEYGGGFYHTFNDLYIYYTALAFKNFNSNNLVFNRIKVQRIKSFLTTNGGKGTVTVRDSSFERFTGILFTGSSGSTSSINISNTYFENYIEDINVPPQLGSQYLGRVITGYATVILLSNTIFAKGISRFLYGSSVLRQIISLGNYISYASTNSSLEILLYHTNTLESIICNDIAIDELTGDGSYTPKYISSTVSNGNMVAGAGFIYNPFTKQIEDINCSSTSRRPTKGLYKGYQFYDLDLSKPIWWDGLKWVDINGSSV